MPRDDRALPQAAADDALIRGHGLAGRALLAFAERLQRIENHLLLSGDGGVRPLPAAHRDYAEAIESLLEQPRYLMLMVMATFVVIL
jgi:hypothetical protein